MKSFPMTRETVLDLLDEYQSVRNDVGLTDCSDWLKYKISGFDARDFLDRVLTGNLQQLGENEILHTMALDAAGNFLCDMLVVGGFEDFILLAPAAQAEGLRTLVETAGEDDEVEVADLTSDMCMIRIDGPKTADLPMAIMGGAVSGLRIMAFAEGDLAGEDVIVGRIGLTGEFGFFFIANASLKQPLMDAIREEVPEAGTCGQRIHDLLQLETRSFNAQQDMPGGEHPLEAGLHWMIDFHKPEFTGRDAFLARMEQGIARQMICLRLDKTDQLPPQNAVVKAAGQTDDAIGYVAHAAWSPTLETGLCLAYLDRDWAAVGLPVAVEGPAGDMAGAVVSAPFFTTRSNSAR